jgi:hypothetical protein
MGIRGPAIVLGAAATENIVALCDVDEERSARGFAQYPNAKKYRITARCSTPKARISTR